MIKEDFNRNWEFYKEGSNERTTVDLPHDAMIIEQRNPNMAEGNHNAYFPGGVYYYEKTFDVPLDWKDKHIEFEFESVYHNSKVYINNVEVGGRPNGYLPIHITANDHLKYGETNTIRVVADNSNLPNSRWYTGSGIYRPVYLYISNKHHIQHEGMKISTLSYDPAVIKVDTAHNGDDVHLEIIYDGKVIVEGRGDSTEITIPDAKLWSDETPNLYECRAILFKDDMIVDEKIEKFGICKIEWSPKGLFINGKETLLRGGCVHHDHGILGAATFNESEDRRVRKLKEAGYNAIRSSHNPASIAMLEACDKYGMYMMDETWDMWFESKNTHDYALHFMDWYKKDIESLVNRDFNHPCVIMYSIGNEVSEPKDEQGVNLAKEMVEYIHALDSNRAVTCGINLMIIFCSAAGIDWSGGGDAASEAEVMSSTKYNEMVPIWGAAMNRAGASPEADKLTSPVLDALDIAGYNYASSRYPLDGTDHPDRIVVGTETYTHEIYKNWEMVKKYPYLIGDFMWTSWDYLGEVGIGSWAYSGDTATMSAKPYPWLLAGPGAIDILGNMDAAGAYAGIVWGVRTEPYIGVRPVNQQGNIPIKAIWRDTNAKDSWSWKGCVGNDALIEVYADAASVKLFLNGELLEQKDIFECKAIFETKYAIGELVAVALDDNGNEISRSKLTSGTGNVQISIDSELEVINNGEIAYININLTDENGVVESNADQLLSVTVSGGELLAFGSANPRTEEQYHAGQFTTYYGKALAIVRKKEAGEMTIKVTGEGLKDTSKTLTVK